MISQREAKRLQKRVRQLEEDARRRNNAWVTDYPGGVDLGCIDVPQWLFYSAHTARKLGHAVVITTAAGDPKIRFYACK